MLSKVLQKRLEQLDLFAIVLLQMRKLFAEERLLDVIVLGMCLGDLEELDEALGLELVEVVLVVSLDLGQEALDQFDVGILQATAELLRVVLIASSRPRPAVRPGSESQTGSTHPSACLHR